MTVLQVKTITTQVPERLDTICFREYGAVNHVVETTLATNPGLADLGYTVPAGTVIALPVVTPDREAEEVVRLWT